MVVKLIDKRQGRPPGRCFPPVPNVDCSATTITSGIATDSCVDTRRCRAGCSYGFACVAAGQNGSGRSVALCTAIGAGEVGVPCTQHGEHVFGDCVSALGEHIRDCIHDGAGPSGTTCMATGGLPVEGQSLRPCR
jgi:hypothetical protein